MGLCRASRIYLCLRVSIMSMFLASPDCVGLLRWLECVMRTEGVVRYSILCCDNVGKSVAWCIAYNKWVKGERRYSKLKRDKLKGSMQGRR